MEATTFVVALTAGVVLTLFCITLLGLAAMLATKRGKH